jgi:hypothetical protein
MFNVVTGLERMGFSGTDVAKTTSQNRLSFFEKSFIGKD